MIKAAEPLCYQVSVHSVSIWNAGFFFSFGAFVSMSCGLCCHDEFTCHGGYQDLRYPCKANRLVGQQIGVRKKKSQSVWTLKSSNLQDLEVRSDETKAAAVVESWYKPATLG